MSVSIDGHPFTFEFDERILSLKTNSLGTLWHLATRYRHRLITWSQKPPWTLLGKTEIKVFFLGGLIYSQTFG